MPGLGVDGRAQFWRLQNFQQMARFHDDGACVGQGTEGQGDGTPSLAVGGGFFFLNGAPHCFVGLRVELLQTLWGEAQTDRVGGVVGGKRAMPVFPVGSHVESARALAGFLQYAGGAHSRGAEDAHLALHGADQIPDRGFGHKAIGINHALAELAGWRTTGAVHVKKDVHRENSLNGPRSRMEDVTSSFALATERDLVPGWRLFMGASYDRRDAGTAQDPSTNGTATFATQDQDGWNAQAGVVGDVGPGALRASVSRKVRFATMFERYSYRLGNGLPNPGLKPEAAVNYEIGYLWKVTPALTLDASAFVSDFDDIIQSATVRAGPPVVSQSQNIGEARISGVELSARAELPSGARLVADYTYLDRELRNRPGLRLFGTPHHTLNLRGEVPIGPVTLVPSLLAPSRAPSLPPM